jgi:cellobiose PTS system EIIC component
VSTIIASLEKAILPVAVKLGKQPHINAIKNGFIKLMPLTLAGAMFVLINNVFLSFGEGSFFYSMGVRLDPATIATLDGFKSIGGSVYNGTLGIMSLMAPFFIGHAMAEERKVDPLSAGLLSVAAFMTVTPFSVGDAYAVGANWLGGANIISGMLIGIVSAEMFAFIIRRNWVIRLPDSVPTSVARSFSALIPGFIILSIMGIVAYLLQTEGSNFHQIIMDTISTPLSNMGGLVGWVYVLFSPLLWFFGVHGSLALSALENGILVPFTLENVALYTQYGSVDAAIAAGKAFHVWTKPMLDSYIFLGGTGATLGLILAVFMVSRRDDYRQVAKLGLPAGIFQINEPILFGLPVIMNPVLLIPFVMVQPVLATITLFAYHTGFIPPITNMAPWTMPAGLGAFFNTNGSITAALLAIFNLGVATLMYVPFVLIANKAQAVIEEEKEESEEDIALALKF